MSKGVVMFAYNGGYDYVKLATVSAALAKRYLGLPVTLITDQEITDPVFDSVIIQERTDPVQLTMIDGELKPWHNQNRSTVYNLTPYDQTLLIDVDYFIMNDNLLELFDTNIDFACYNSATDIADRMILERRIGNTGIPMQWATVIYFTKNELAESVFNFIEYIKQHYEFYSLMYNFRPDKFRNDYALSIALQALTGYNTGNFSQIPEHLDTLTLGVTIVDVRENGEIVFMHPNGVTKDMKVSVIKNVSIHILHKYSLFGNEHSLDKFKILYEKS
jgi:hypothetical protein